MSARKTVSAPFKALRERDRAKTAEAMRQALTRLVTSEERISIAAVARAVGVTPALIHNKYPEVANAIRGRSGKPLRATRALADDQLTEARETIRALRDERVGPENEVRKLASINEALRRQLAEAQAIARANNVTPLPRDLKPRRP